MEKSTVRRSIFRRKSSSSKIFSQEDKRANKPYLQQKQSIIGITNNNSSDKQFPEM